ncbi:MAG: hypothetical protein GC147_01040 [Porphyrobacter sp.]|nr:hypothetical protein [Porphyrobacter sp.]
MIATLQPATPSTRTFRRSFAVLAALLLAVPLVAMQFTREVVWTPGDFIVAAGLLALLGLGIDSALRLRSSALVRGAAVLLALAAFLTVWAELAVGIFA